jgi:hypothetical protein
MNHKEILNKRKLHLWALYLNTADGREKRLERFRSYFAVVRQMRIHAESISPLAWSPIWSVNDD